MEEQVILEMENRLVELDLSPAMLEVERTKDMDLSLIGASDVPALLGLSPWAGPADVQRRILGEETFDPSPAAYWGNVMEPSIIDAYARGRGMTYSKPGSKSHPKGRPWQRVSLDALSDDGGVIVEAKCVNDRRWETEFGGGRGLPASIIAQVQTQLEAYDCDEAVVLVSRWDEPGRVWAETVTPDAEMQERILETCENFWRKHIVDREPLAAVELPPPPASGDLEVHDFSEEAEMLSRLAQIRRNLKAEEAEEAELKAILSRRLYDARAERIKSTFGTVSRVKPSAKEKVSWEDVAAMVRGRFSDEEWRAVIEQCTKVQARAGHVMIRTKDA